MQQQLSSGDAVPAIVVMGVCGVGKSLIAEQLSQRLTLGLVEADDFHSESNRQKMAEGIALSDADRTPWLNTVVEAAISRRDEAGGVVVACSALRKTYRDFLGKVLEPSIFVHLSGPKELIAQRLTDRQDHFVGKALLDSQLKTLEPLERGEPGFVLDISTSIDLVVEGALEGLRKRLPGEHFIAE
jgi:gluconokinase